MKLTPTHLDLLAQLVPGRGAVGPTRAFVVGGEALTGRSLAFWRSHAPGTRLINEYGPTETVVGCCAYEVSAQAATTESVPIGRPIANTQVYLLDRRLRPVPVGIPGELYVGGAGLARGYLNSPALTAVKFIPHPFSDAPGARLYKTGDLARRLPDGDLEFLGRLDQQVKVRGFRIELGEVEAALRQHPAVQQAVVLAREDVPGESLLVAYLVASAAPPASEWRRFLREKLPDYMIPSAFLLLPGLPLTPNGKLDRNALPAPDRARPLAEEAYVAPRTSAEEMLAGIWAEVLGVERVGAHDNFFDLGADSILSMLVVARARQAGLQLTPKQVFQHQTIYELAALVGTAAPAPAEQGPVTGPVPPTPIQLWFLERDLPAPHHYNQSFLLEVPPLLEPEPWERAVRHLLRHHDTLRLRLVRTASGWVQAIAAPDQATPLGVWDLAGLSRDEQSAAITATATKLQAELNLSDGPVLYVGLFRLGAHATDRLLVIAHHLAVDAVSWRILFEDLYGACRQDLAGDEWWPPPKTSSFKDWAGRLAGYAQSDALAAEAAYWLAPPRAHVAPLPVDYSSGREANTVATAGRVSVALTVAQTRSLLEEVPPVYRTRIDDVLLTALALSLAPWTGERSLLVDLEGHGREGLFADVDLSRTVGWFTTLYPVLLDPGDAGHPGKALVSIKEQLRCVPRRGIGYGLLRYLARDPATVAKLKAFPPAEVLFNYLGRLDLMLANVPGWGLAPESAGPTRDPRGKRTHLLEIDGFVLGGQLQLQWTYGQNVHRRATVELLAHGFREALLHLIDHCRSPEAGRATPSDFPLAKLDERQLDKLSSVLDKADGPGGRRR